MHKERITFLKIFITLGLLISLPLVIIMTNSPRQKQDVRSKAASTAPVAGKIIFVPYSFSKDKDDDDIFEFKEKPQIRNGFVLQNQISASLQYTAKLLDKTGKTIATQKFSLPQIVALDKFDQKQRKAHAELKKVKANNHGLTLPYRSDASFIQIVNNRGEVVKTVSLTNASSFNNILDLKEIYWDTMKNNWNMLNQINILPKNQVLATNGTFNITIIGDNYNGDNLHFQNDVNDIASGLLSIEPFKSYKTNIVFYPQLSTVPICTYTNPTLSCNDTLSLKEASGTPYDKIYVIYNGPYAGYAYLGATLAYGTNATNMTAAVKKGLFIHELAGHTLAGLMDEYSYGTTGASYAPNCSDFPSCPSWNTITGLGCFTSCGFTNLYRATDNGSVMNTALLTGTLNFDAFSTQIVNGKLATFLGAAPPTPTLPPQVPTPTITPTLTPSITPTPTITPGSITPTATSVSRGFNILSNILSPTPTQTPTPTLTPTATLTPAPTQTTSCSFPNFCTQLKYCDTENIIPVNCNIEGKICCKAEVINTPTPTVKNQPSPTPIQRFEPLPTISSTPTFIPSKTPTPSPANNQPFVDATTPSPTKTPTPTIIIENDFMPEISAVSPTKTAYLGIKPQENTPATTLVIVPTVTNIIEKTYSIYPEFERATPTQLPKVGILDILAAPTRFVNNLVRSFFSLFSNK